jgi:mRNA interferase MazF
VTSPEPFRGEIWDVRFPNFGLHPAIILSVNALNTRLGHVAVIPVTGTSGPTGTHIPLNADAGLTRYDESYADVTGLQPVARGNLRRRRGLLTAAELARVEGLVRAYLGL